MKISLLSAAVVAACAGVACANDILFVSDNSANQGIVTALAGDGHNVTSVLNDFSGGNNPTLLGNLSSYFAVYWSASGTGFGDAHTNAAVFTNLTNYVQAGGRVLVTGYDSIASPSDPLLIQFLGGSGSIDVPASPGPISNDPQANPLTIGVRDIRGLTPSGLSGDRDALTGLGNDTFGVVQTVNANSFQWTLRTLGNGYIAYISNGDAGNTNHPAWTTDTNDGSGAVNGAIRNFAIPTPGAAGLLVLGGIAAGRRRR